MTSQSQKVDDANALQAAVEVIKRNADNFGPALTFICGILEGMADDLFKEAAKAEFRRDP